MTRTCLIDVPRLEAREESEGAKRAERVAGLWFVEGCVSDTAIEAL